MSVWFLAEFLDAQTKLEKENICSIFIELIIFLEH